MSQSNHANCPWCRTNENLETVWSCNRVIHCAIVCGKCLSRGPKVDNDAEAWSAWDAINKGEWIKAPTEPGWWWCRFNELREVAYVDATTLRHGVFTRMDGGVRRVSNYQWQGPIEPKE